jgi:hypothetical protein
MCVFYCTIVFYIINITSIYRWYQLLPHTQFLSRKTKCDNQRPRCGFCVATGGYCRYADSDLSQLDRSSLTILERISKLETSLMNHIDQTWRERSSASTDPNVSCRLSSQPLGSDDRLTPLQEYGSFSGTPGSAAIQNPNSQSHLVSKAQQISTVKDAGFLLTDAPPSTQMLLRASEMSIESLLKWPVFSEAAPHLIPAFQVPLVEVAGHPEPNCRTTGLQSSTTIPDLDRDAIDRLVQNFLDNNYVKNPILDVQSLRAFARDFAESGPQWDAKSCLLVGSFALCFCSIPDRICYIAFGFCGQYSVIPAESWSQFWTF